MLGHFIAYNTLWGSATVDARNRQVEQFINNQIINIMNNCAPIRISYNTDTAVDLTMCSPHLEVDLHWIIATWPEDSDICPVFVSFEEAQQGDGPMQKRGNIERLLGICTKDQRNGTICHKTRKAIMMSDWRTCIEESRVRVWNLSQWRNGANIS